jgi:hypothetical protein
VGLAWASVLGAAMRPEEIEELLAAMSQTKIECTIPKEKDERHLRSPYL